MTKDKALKIIKDNADSKNSSFLEFLHEYGQFNENAYWDFYNALKYVTNRNKDTLSRDLTWNIIKPYERFLLLIGFHFDKDDVYNIDNLPKNYGAYSLRLREVIDAYIQGYKIDKEREESFDDNLDNPLD